MAGRSLLISASFLASLVLASPVVDNRKATSTSSAAPAHSSCHPTEHDANFDDLQGLTGSELNPLPTPYMGLDYQGFLYSQVLAPGTAPGVEPHSPPNYISASLASEEGLSGGTPMLSVYYPNSIIKSFTLESFYFGCVVNLGQAATAANSACNIEITGYRGSDNSVSNAQQVCSQQFQYNPSSAIAVQQQAYSGAVKGCKDIQFAIVTFSAPGGLAVTNPDLALVLDDIKYSTCT